MLYRKGYPFAQRPEYEYDDHDGCYDDGLDICYGLHVSRFGFFGAYIPVRAFVRSQGGYIVFVVLVDLLDAAFAGNAKVVRFFGITVADGIASAVYQEYVAIQAVFIQCCQDFCCRLAVSAELPGYDIGCHYGFVPHIVFLDLVYRVIHGKHRHIAYDDDKAYGQGRHEEHSLCLYGSEHYRFLL